MEDNSGRILMAQEIVDSVSYFEEDDMNSNISDIITNMLHLAHDNGIDVDGLLAAARVNFEEEVA